MVTNGASSAVEDVSWTMANPGEDILLDRPYYRISLLDIGAHTGEGRHGCLGMVDSLGMDMVQVRRSLRELGRGGHEGSSADDVSSTVGKCYLGDDCRTDGVLQKHWIHLVSDEIYASSVWENQADELGRRPAEFESAWMEPSMRLV